MARRKKVVIPNPVISSYRRGDENVVEVSYYQDEDGTAVRHDIRWIEFYEVTRRTRCEVDGKPITDSFDGYAFDDDDPGG